MIQKSRLTVANTFLFCERNLPMEKFTRFTKVTAFHAFAILFIAIMPRCVLGQELKHLATLEKYLADDVVGIVYFDLEKLDLAALAKIVTDVNALKPDEVEMMNEGVVVAQQALGRFADHGITRIYVLLRTTDIQNFGTSVIIPIPNEVLAKRTEEEIVEFAEQQFNTHAPSAEHFVRSFEINDGVLMATGTESQMETLKTAQSSRRSITAGMEAIGTGTAGALLFGDRDSRRVIEELLPSLPAPFEAITGEMIAKEIEWLGLRVNLNEVVEFKLSAESTTPVAAETIASCARTGLSMLKLLGPVREVIPDNEIKFVFDCLAPQVDGTRVTISTEKITDDKDRVTEMLRKQIGEMRGAAQEKTWGHTQN